MRESLAELFGRIDLTTEPTVSVPVETLRDWKTKYLLLLAEVDAHDQGRAGRWIGEVTARELLTWAEEVVRA